jgi:predicted acylesterase/phospholipase RssA
MSNPAGADPVTTTLSSAEPIDLLLSGGGFRASIFHLGVLRYFAETGQIDKIRRVYSVSGGSVLAGFFALNWESLRSLGDFDLAASELVRYVQSDVRGRIIRRYLAFLALIAAAALACFSLCWMPISDGWPHWLGLAGLGVIALLLYLRRPSLISLFERDLSAFLHSAKKHASRRKPATLQDIPETGPDFRICTTDLTTGVPWVFSRNGVSRETDSGWRDFQDELYPLSRAVAASAAFPPLFSPVSFPKSKDDDEFAIDHWLADGGIYDNLAIDVAINGPWNSPLARIVISNAERPFDEVTPGSFSLLSRRAARSSDIQMNRASTLHSKFIEEPQIRLGDFTDGVAKRFPISVQRQIRKIRTDLDSFTPAEIQLLYFKGYSSAWCNLDPSTEGVTEGFEFSGNGIPIATSKPDKWLPFRSEEPTLHLPVDESLSKSARNQVRLFTTSDFSGSWMLAVALAVVLLVNPLIWGATRAAWDHLPSWPRSPRGDWGYLGPNGLPTEFPKSIKDLKDPFLHSVLYRNQLVAGDALVGCGFFVSNPLSTSYGWAPRGSFWIEIDCNHPLRITNSEAALVYPDGSFRKLNRKGVADSIHIEVPAGQGQARLLLAVAGIHTSRKGASGAVAPLFTNDSVKLRISQPPSGE